MQPGNTVMTALLLALGLFSGAGQAESTKALLHGKVVSIPCYINSKNTLDFDFQRIGIKRVDGIRYAVTQDVPIKCDQSVNAKLYLKVRSTQTSATKSNVLKTDVDNLGIALYDENQNTELPLNTDVLIDDTQTFRIKAIPVKEDTSKPLEAKPFTVTATVIAYYE